MVLAALELLSWRPLQVQALDVLHRADLLCLREGRIVTAAVVLPTGTGKDVLPLAWAVAQTKVNILFVPFVHLAAQALEAAR